MTAKTKRVLVVEDESNWRELIGDLVRNAAEELGITIEVEVAPSCTEALNRLKSLSYDCVTIDNKLPDGKMARTVLDRVSELDQRVPVVVVSGAVKPDDVRDFFKDYKVDEFFWKKGFDPKQFKQTLRKLLVSEDSKLQSRSQKQAEPAGGVSVLVTLVVASLVFVGLLFGIVGAFRFAVGGNIVPKDLIVLAPVAVVLALVLYPFILVLLNIFSPKMAERQFNQLQSFVKAAFPSLLNWLDNLSGHFGKQPEQEPDKASATEIRE